MRKTVKGKLLALGLGAALICSTISGCGVGDVEVVWKAELSGNTIFRIGEKEGSIQDGKIFLLSYRNMYSQIYGSQVWESSDKGQTMEEYVKKVSLTQLAKLKSLALLAENKGISLTDQERKDVEVCTTLFFESLTKEEKKFLDVGEQEIQNLYEEYALATKLYTTLTGGVKEEVSDDDARVMRVRQIIVSDETSAKEISEKIKNGDDFGALASYYNKSESSEAVLYKQQLSEVLFEGIEKLAEGEISECIEEDGRYYFFEMIMKIDRELTEENKLTIVKDRATEAFDDVYDEFISNLSSSYNYELWNETGVPSELVCTQASFFEIFEGNLGYLKTEK